MVLYIKVSGRCPCKLIVYDQVTESDEMDKYKAKKKKGGFSTGKIMSGVQVNKNRNT